MMKRFAHVVAGVVENISEAETSEFAHGGIELVAGTDDEVGIGDLYDGSAFSKKPKTPEQLAREAQAAEDAAVRADAKADAVTQYLVSHTPLEIYQYVRGQVNAHNATNLAELKTAVVELQNLVGKLAAVVGADFRTRMR